MSAPEDNTADSFFHITDHSRLTDFESLTSSIDLYLRHHGFSSDIRTHSQYTASKQFRFADCEFSCFHCPRKGEKPQRSSSGEPDCLIEMRTGLPNFYPFTEHILVQLFGISEFLIIRGKKIPQHCEATIFSAFAVGAQEAKCSLPFFMSRSEKRGPVKLMLQGMLLFPGYFASFYMWKLRKPTRNDPKYQFGTGVKPVVDFFTTQVERSAEGIKVDVYTAYRLSKAAPHRSGKSEGIAELAVFCRWPTRPAEACSDLSIQQCEGFRVKITLDTTMVPISDCFLQLNRSEPDDDTDIDLGIPLDIPDLDQFEDVAIRLEGVLPLFPLNSLWTKMTIQLMSAGQLSPSAIVTFISYLRELRPLPTVIPEHFAHFSHCSELHQHILVVLSASQSLYRIRNSETGDPASQLVFLHNSPAHFLEQEVIDPASAPLYKESLLGRVLRAYLLDMYIKTGFQPTVSQVIEWHREMIDTYEFYRNIATAVDDGKLLSLWSTVTSKSFSDHTAFVTNELTKELEMSLQSLEGLGPADIEKQLVGMTVSAAMAVILRKQSAGIVESQTHPTIWVEIKELLRPGMDEFRRACKQAQSDPNETIGCLRKAVNQLEISISKAFSLARKFPESKGLTSKLMETNEFEVVDGQDRSEIVLFLTSLRPSDLWQTQVVLRTANSRFCCVTEGNRVKMALAKVVRETEPE